jgi:ATP-dependent RNA helicase DDX49/DBP8
MATAQYADGGHESDSLNNVSDHEVTEVVTEHHRSRKRKKLSDDADPVYSRRAKEVLTAIAHTLSPNDNRSGMPGFASLGVDHWLVKSLSYMAIWNPTPIQRETIPAILRGQDCIGISRTGTGKTVAFAVPILQMWARDPMGSFAVVLTATRLY